ncbi:MAG: YCF48-related protein [Bacteroidota bacterium]
MFRFSLLLGLFVVLFSTVSAQSNWQTLANAPNFIGPFSKLDDVHFIDLQTGWTINSLGTVFKTEDSGQNWTEQTNLGEFIRCVRFADENVGYIGSLQGNFGGGNSVSRLFKTIDGGDTWTDLTDLISPAPIGICGLSVVDAQNVYGVGAYYQPARMYKTSDGGASWTNIDMSAHAASLVDVHFFTPDTGFVVGLSSSLGQGGVVLKTTNGGLDWEAVHETMVNSDLIWKIQALDRQHLYAAIAGVSLDFGGRILVSEDGGESWISKQVDVGDVHLQGVGFISPTHGFAGGFFNGLYETTDGGDSWTLKNIGANYNRFQKLNDTLMVASGHSIYRYTNDELTAVAEVEKQLKPPYEMTIHPMPLQQEINIEYRLDNATHLDLSLYDSKGKKVLNFHNGWHASGIFNIRKPLENIPAGFYVVAFLSREGDVIQKVVIQP